MKNIISAFTTLFVLVLNIFMCTQLLAAAGQTAAAREYRADVVAQIENSNFNPNVVAACIRQAAQEGYVLEVNGSTYDGYGCIQTAEVVLAYDYRLPLFGISETKTTRGIAR